MSDSTEFTAEALAQIFAACSTGSRITGLDGKEYRIYSLRIDHRDAILQALHHLADIDRKEAEYGRQPKGATAADCIGFLYRMIDSIKLNNGLGDILSRKMFSATIAHLNELVGRREAADRPFQEARRQKEEATREQRKKYDEQNRQREQKQNEWKNRFDEFFRMYEDHIYRGSFDGAQFKWENASGKAGKAKPAAGKRPWYEVLGIEAKADRATIKAAYRRLAKKFHPDRCTDKDANERMTEINVAYREALNV